MEIITQEPKKDINFYTGLISDATARTEAIEVLLRQTNEDDDADIDDFEDEIFEENEFYDEDGFPKASLQSALEEEKKGLAMRFESWDAMMEFITEANNGRTLEEAFAYIDEEAKRQKRERENVQKH